MTTRRNDPSIDVRNDMATKTTPEAADGYHSPFGQELAPSAVRAEEPGTARMVGLIGPRAMDYPKAVTAVGAAEESLSLLAEELYRG